MIKAQPKDVVPHLRWHLARLGIYSQDDALLEGIVVSQRERAKTLKEMAENSRFFFGDEVTLDREGRGETPDGRCEGAAGASCARGSRALPEWDAPAVHAALEGARDRRSRWVSGKSRSRCASRCRAARCRRPSMRRWRCSARRARWRAWTARQSDRLS